MLAVQNMAAIVGWDEPMAASMRTWADIVDRRWGKGRGLGYYAPGLDNDRQRRNTAMLERAWAGPSMIRAIATAGIEARHSRGPDDRQAPTVVMMTRRPASPESCGTSPTWCPIRSFTCCLPRLRPTVQTSPSRSDHRPRRVSGDRVDATHRIQAHLGDRSSSPTSSARPIRRTSWAMISSRNVIERHKSILRAHVDAHGGRFRRGRSATSWLRCLRWSRAHDPERSGGHDAVRSLVIEIGAGTAHRRVRAVSATTSRGSPSTWGPSTSRGRSPTVYRYLARSAIYVTALEWLLRYRGVRGLRRRARIVGALLVEQGRYRRHLHDLPVLRQPARVRPRDSTTVRQAPAT